MPRKIEEKNIGAKVNEIKNMRLKGEMEWEIDFSEMPHYLQDDEGNAFKPFLFAIVHPESYFVIKAHLASPTGDYFLEFLDELLNTLIKSEFYPKKILVKKKELFDFFSEILKELNIELELVGRTRAVESIKREYSRQFK